MVLLCRAQRGTSEACLNEARRAPEVRRAILYRGVAIVECHFQRLPDYTLSDERS